MPCHATDPMQDYFWKVFHKYYNLICILICTPICTKNFILAKSGCYNGLGPKASKRDVRDAQQPLHFQAPYDIFRYTTKEMHNIASQHCTSKETT
jgi:hypothetical protein